MASSAFVAKREAPAAPPAAPQPRRRNLPGNPDPNAEVVALSPGTLMATNRFICEVCNKGFQREQNLQLHRRGHNLPWKLKQRSTGVARRKVYLCPEPSCIHHDPSRALGDLTGIKKHYLRKHGEKKFKCQKCKKKYAVQSDLKAHMKTCGTREYRCDCGTLFSRRDSFITHRAFCDALAQETAAKTSFVGLGTGNMLSHTSHQIAGATAPSPLRSLLASSSSTYRPHMAASSSSFFQYPETVDFRLKVAAPMMHGGHGLVQLPHHHELQSHSGGSSSGAAQPGMFNLSHSGGSSSGAAAPAPGMFNLAYFPSNRSNSGGDSGGGDSSNVTLPISSHFNSTDLFSNGGSSFFAAAPTHPVGGHMSATALLQKAALIGSISSITSEALLRSFSSHPAKLEHGHHQLEFGTTGGGPLYHGLEHSLFASHQGPPATLFPAAYANVGPHAGLGGLRRSSSSGGASSSRATVGGEGLTRDFLGMRAAAAAASGGGETAHRKDRVRRWVESDEILKRLCCSDEEICCSLKLRF